MKSQVSERTNWPCSCTSSDLTTGLLSSNDKRGEEVVLFGPVFPVVPFVNAQLVSPLNRFLKVVTTGKNFVFRLSASRRLNPKGKLADRSPWLIHPRRNDRRHGRSYLAEVENRHIRDSVCYGQFQSNQLSRRRSNFLSVGIEWKANIEILNWK